MKNEIAAAENGNVKAIRKLIELGPEALREVADTMVQKKDRLHVGLSSVIRNAKPPSSKTILIELAKWDDLQVSNAACCALTAHPGDDAIQCLIERIETPGLKQKYLGQVFSFIGKNLRTELEGTISKFIESSMGKSKPKDILEQLNNWLEDGDIRAALTFVDGAKALGQLGNSKWSASIHLLVSQAPKREQSPYWSELVAHAVNALNYLPSSSTIGVLAELAQDDYWEVRQNAVWGLYLIGTKDVIDPLIGFLEDDDFQTRSNALVYIWHILGQWPAGISEVDEIDSATASKWWNDIRSDLRGTILHRDGKPIDYGATIHKLKDKYHRKEVLDELIVYTGTDFGMEDFCPVEQQWQLPDHAIAWWHNNKDNFESGKHYRMGLQLSLW